MRRWIIAAFLLALLGSAGAAAEYPCRWVYVSHGLRRDTDAADILKIVRTASEHGLTGMVSNWVNTSSFPPPPLPLCVGVAKKAIELHADFCIITLSVRKYTFAVPLPPIP